MMRAVLMLGCLGTAVGVLAGQPAEPSSDAEKVGRVLADWKARQERLQSVRYVLSGTEESLGGPVMPGFPSPVPGVRPLKAVVLLDVAQRRFRIDQAGSKPNSTRDGHLQTSATEAYNGSIYQTAYPRTNPERNPEAPDLAIMKGSLASTAVTAKLWPVFEAHGIVPTEAFPLRPDRLPADHEADEFSVRGTVTHAGRQCLVLRDQPTNTTPALVTELWVDPGKQSAVVRHVHYQRKNPWHRIDVEYGEGEHGWLPRGWTFTNTIGDELRYVARLKVESIEANPSLASGDFTLPIEPGMVVLTANYPDPGTGLDPSMPAKLTQRVDANGRMEDIEREGFRTLEGVQLPPESPRPWWLWAGLGVAVVAAGYLMVRFAPGGWKWRTNRQTPRKP